MGSITFDRFDLGIDLRKGASVSDANRLREMMNAYVTTGLATQKRPGLVKVTTLEPGTKGLFPAFGKLHTFYGVGTIVHADSRFQANKTLYYSGEQRAVLDVQFADVFNGYIYASIMYDNRDVRHHYLDGTADSGIVDANCPHSSQVLKLASKIYAASRSGDIVRYSKTGNPRDWSTINDAGFLPTGLNARGDRATNALGVYQNKLVALARDGSQVWFVDPDPSANKLEDIVENVGTSYPRTVATVAGDLYFLSDFGFRSITTLQLVSKLADVDIGSPIDSIVRPATKNSGYVPRAAYYYGTGQYVCAIGEQLFVYSISRTAKVAAWSRYILPFPVDALAELQGVLYIRAGDNIYQLSDAVSADDGQPFEVMLELPYMDFKSPGQTKRVYGVDLVMEGQCDFSIAFDVRNPDAYTPPVTVRGNTRGGGVIPIECAGTEFSLRFRNFDNKPFRLDAVTVYYDNLGAI
jgi:hypothetical protein